MSLASKRASEQLQSAHKGLALPHHATVWRLGRFQTDENTGPTRSEQLHAVRSAWMGMDETLLLLRDAD